MSLWYIHAIVRGAIVTPASSLVSAKACHSRKGAGEDTHVGEVLLVANLVNFVHRRLLHNDGPRAGVDHCDVTWEFELAGAHKWRYDPKCRAHMNASMCVCVCVCVHYCIIEHANVRMHAHKQEVSYCFDPL